MRILGTLLCRLRSMLLMQATSPKMERWPRWQKERVQTFYDYDWNFYENQVCEGLDMITTPRGHALNPAPSQDNVLYTISPSLTHRSSTSYVKIAVSDTSRNPFTVAQNPVAYPRLRFDVPTLFLPHFLVKEFHRLTTASRKALTAQLSPYPQTAWMFYEAMVIVILESSTGAFNNHLCGVAGVFKLGTGLPNVVPDLEGDFTVEIQRIYVPPNLASQDAFVIMKRLRVVFLHITTVKKHDLNRESAESSSSFPVLIGASIKWLFCCCSTTRTRLKDSGALQLTEKL